MPVFESHLSDHGGSEIGRRICDERQRLGLTLQELAGRSGLSTARLSQIENGLFIPDVEQSHEIARGLGVAIGVLLPDDRVLSYQIKRYREVRDSEPHARGPADGAVGSEMWLLADSFVGRQIEPMLVRLLPGHPQQFRHQPGLEFACVLKGRVEFLIETGDGEHREELERGDCIYVRSHHPHSFRCLDEQPAECLHVLSAAVAGGVTGLEWLPGAAAGRRNGNGSAKGNALLGAQLAALRRAHGWTGAQVAEVAGMRERLVDQIENGERNPPLNVLARLARAYGRPLRELLHDSRDPQPYYLVRRSDEIRTLPARPRRLPTDRPDAPTPNSYHPLFPDFPTLHMYPYLVRIRNIDMQMLVPHEHHGHEFFYVLDGQIELLTYADARTVSTLLGPGDSCYLDASVPHLLRGESRNPYSPSSAELIDVYWCSLGEEYLFDRAQPGASERGI